MIKKQNHWNIELNPIDNTVGFIYMITNKTNKKFYIGKKQFYTTRNTRLSKKKSNELYTGKGRKPTKEKVIKESDWKTYTGSNKELNNDILLLGKDKFTFKILLLCTSLSELKYKEMVHQIFFKCLETPLSYNEWIKITITKKQLNG